MSDAETCSGSIARPPGELRRRWEARKHFELSLAMFNQVSLEIAFAERMLRDELPPAEVVPLIIALRRSDPNMVVTASDQAQAESAVDIARRRLEEC